MNSWCSRCALLTSATVGCAMRGQVAISPGWFMPISITAARDARAGREQRQRHADVVVQIAAVARHARRRRTAARGWTAIISLTVVLPLLPVTPTSGIAKRRAPVRGERAERGARVGDDDQRARRNAWPASRVDQRRGRAAARASARRNRAPSKCSPLKRDEQSPAATRGCRSTRRRTAHRPSTARRASGACSAYSGDLIMPPFIVARAASASARVVGIGERQLARP